MPHFQNIDVFEQRSGVHGVDMDVVTTGPGDSMVATQGVTIASFGAASDAIYSSSDSQVLFNHANLFSGQQHGINFDTTSFSTVINFGDIFGQGYGVSIGGDSVSDGATNNRFDNDGAVNGNNGGVFMVGNRSTLDNGANGDISGYNFGVLMEGEGNDLINAGRITSQNRGSFAVQLFDTLTPTGAAIETVLQNSGEIIGAGSEHMSIDDGFGGFDRVNMGAAVELASGNATVINNTGLISHEHTAITTRIVRDDGNGEGIATIISLDSHDHIRNDGGTIIGDVIVGNSGDRAQDIIENLGNGVIDGSIVMEGDLFKDNVLINEGFIGGNIDFPNDPFTEQFDDDIILGEGDDDVLNTGQIAIDDMFFGSGANRLDNSGAILADDIDGLDELRNTGTILADTIDTLTIFENWGTVDTFFALRLAFGGDFTNHGDFTGELNFSSGSALNQIVNTGSMSNIDGFDELIDFTLFTNGAADIFNSGDMRGEIDITGTGRYDVVNDGTYAGQANFESSATESNSFANNGTWTGDLSLGDGFDSLTNTGILTGPVNMGTGGGVIVNTGEMLLAQQEALVLQVVEGDGTNTQTGDYVVDNKNIIRGSVALGSGDDRFNNEGRLNGDLDMGDGNDTLDIRLGYISGVAGMGDGDDLIVVDRNDIAIDGGAGTDTLFSFVDFDLNETGGIENLTIEGDATRGIGNDVDNLINGNMQDNFLAGLSGNDTMNGGEGDDIVRGNNGDDAINTGNGDDLGRGDNGNDTVTGGAGDDTLEGRQGDDILLGGEDFDLLLGHIGNDTIEGGADDDTVQGGRGDDVIQGDTGNDALWGGRGNDLFIWNNGDGSDVVDGGETGAGESNTQRVNAADGAGDLINVELSNTDRLNALGQVENLDFVQLERLNLGNFTIDLFDVQTLEINGQGGNDTVTVEDLSGSQSAVNDGVSLLVFDGGGGQDLLDATRSDVAVSADGGNNNDTISGGNLDDTLLGGGQDDLLDGRAGNDSLDGQTGNDLLLGGGGADTLFGSGGDDTLSGQSGDDVLIGGGGADAFVFSGPLNGTVDTIADMVSGTDQIHLDSSVFSALAPGALAAANFVIGTAAADADDFIIYNDLTGDLLYDADGNGGGAAEVFANIGAGTTLLDTDFLIV